ncbi:MAG: DUF998 domain-containing protein [Pseudonocardia sp.]|nr:DUF998 domain-containing protein [Pseudonocardia sp.]
MSLSPARTDPLLRPPGPSPTGERIAGGTGLAAVGLGLTALSVLLIGLLHVLPPSDTVNPMTRTISEYALGSNGWLFDLAVLALAAGSVAVLIGLGRVGVLRASSAGWLFLILWVAGLVVLVIFEKHNWQAGPSTGGYIHRVASLVAFLSLPAGALLTAGAGARVARWRVPSAVARAAALVALACFSPLLYAIARGVTTGVAWWRVFPLGAVERVLGLSEVLVVLALGWWVLRASAPRTS